MRVAGNLAIFLSLDFEAHFADVWATIGPRELPLEVEDPIGRFRVGSVDAWSGERSLKPEELAVQIRAALIPARRA